MNSTPHQEDLKRALSNAPSSNTAKSCRRIFFNHLTESIKERGHFHSDYFFGSGTATLIKTQEKLFMLTPKHVIENNHIDIENPQNESPFWITSKHNGTWKSLHDFLIPKKLWKIDLEIEEKAEYKHINLTDLYLIELFTPGQYHQPDHFIKINSSSDFLSKQEFYEGQFLYTSGYPENLNSYDHENAPEGFSHSTKVIRHSMIGVFKKDNDTFGHISYELTEGTQNHETTNGMSGSIVYNVQPDIDQIKPAGILVSCDNNIGRFIPFFEIADAIIKFSTANSIEIDPAAEKFIHGPEALEYFLQYEAAHAPDSEYSEQLKSCLKTLKDMLYT